MLQRGEKTTQLFVEKTFAEFYETRFPYDALPRHIDQREFGFLTFKENVMIRHQSFQTPKQFQNFISSFTPLHAYYSAAYYERPDASMARKEWRGADLVFDIDADHLELPCKEKHSFWVCSECQTPSAQYRRACPSCGSPKLRQEAWLCDTCLESAKAETIKLLDFLLQDLGLNSSDLEIRFSGHRGYHVCVVQDEIKALDQAARKEIVDYILGTGLNVEFHGLAKTVGRSKRMIGPGLQDLGWKGRIARGLHDFLRSTNVDDLKRIPKFSMKKRDLILHEWDVNGEPWGLTNIDAATWHKLTKLGIRNQGAHIDTVVTTDLHRLIRLPNTLHGKTGLRAQKIPFTSLDKFDPLTDAVVFRKGRVAVHVYSAHKFKVDDVVYGPFSDETVELPLAAGIYLLCKKAAKLA